VRLPCQCASSFPDSIRTRARRFLRCIPSQVCFEPLTRTRIPATWTRLSVLDFWSVGKQNKQSIQSMTGSLPSLCRLHWGRGYRYGLVPDARCPQELELVSGDQRTADSGYGPSSTYPRYLGRTQKGVFGRSKTGGARYHITVGLQKWEVHAAKQSRAARATGGSLRGYLVLTN
jgi:hypothetical protein